MGITFGTLSSDGQLTDVEIVDRGVIEKCPHVIFDPDHYRPDGTCKCDDPNNSIMKEWGYSWNGTQWIS